MEGFFVYMKNGERKYCHAFEDSIECEKPCKHVPKDGQRYCYLHTSCKVCGVLLPGKQRSFCKDHECEVESCVMQRGTHSHSCESCGEFKAGKHRFCSSCACRLDHCSSLAVVPGQYCAVHGCIKCGQLNCQKCVCRVDWCEEQPLSHSNLCLIHGCHGCSVPTQESYCYKCKCPVYECTNPQLPGGFACQEHQCPVCSDANVPGVDYFCYMDKRKAYRHQSTAPELARYGECVHDERFYKNCEASSTEGYTQSSRCFERCLLDETVCRECKYGNTCRACRDYLMRPGSIYCNKCECTKTCKTVDCTNTLFGGPTDVFCKDCVNLPACYGCGKVQSDFRDFSYTFLKMRPDGREIGQWGGTALPFRENNRLCIDCFPPVLKPRDWPAYVLLQWRHHLLNEWWLPFVERMGGDGQFVAYCLEQTHSVDAFILLKDSPRMDIIRARHTTLYLMARIASLPKDLFYLIFEMVKY